MQKIFDLVQAFNRKVFGKKIEYFIIGTICIVLVGPFLDLILETRGDKVTVFLTLSLLIYVILLLLAFIFSWRDDKGWQWKILRSGLKAYYYVYKDKIGNLKYTKSTLLILAKYLFFSSIFLKGIKILSYFLRENIFAFNNKNLQNIERITEILFWIILIVSVIMILYLYRKSQEIRNNIKKSISQFLRPEKPVSGNKILKILKPENSSLVINAKDTIHINSVEFTNKSGLFIDVVKALSKWKPHKKKYEWEYEHRLWFHLNKTLKGKNKIKRQYPIGKKTAKDKGTVDIVINDSILIELKKRINKAESQRAIGQIGQYAETWKGKGPVILLLCEHDYKEAKKYFENPMQKLWGEGKEVITIIAFEPWKAKI